MTDQKLPQDVCRCLSQDCHQASVCLRYLDKGTNPTEWYSYTDFLALGVQCKWFIGARA